MAQKHIKFSYKHTLTSKSAIDDTIWIVKK